MKGHCMPTCSRRSFLSDRLGFTPVADAPIFDRLDTLLTGEGAKRPDAIWFERGHAEIRCLIEFERYTTQSLTPKAKNLLIVGKELHPTPYLVVLNFWTSVPGHSSSALQEAERVLARGFTHSTGAYFPPLGCPALVLETLVSDDNVRTRIQSITPRLFVYCSEDKPHIVRQLKAI